MRIGVTGGLSVDVELPFGTSGVFIAPLTRESSVAVDGVAAAGEVRLGPGRHAITVTQPRIAETGVSDDDDGGRRSAEDAMPTSSTRSTGHASRP